MLEDSPNGVCAATAAGTNVVAVATPFTKASLHTLVDLDDAWIVHREEGILEVAGRRMAEHNRTDH